MKRFDLLTEGMSDEAVEFESLEGDYVRAEEAEALEARIIDLSAKLDQAIDMLNCQKRMTLLDLWAKEAME